MPDGVDDRCITPPAHAGPSFDAEIPMVFTIILVVAVAIHPDPPPSMVTVYVPAPPSAMPLSVGF